MSDDSKQSARGKLGIISCSSGRHFAEKVISRLETIIEEEQDGTKPELYINSKERNFANQEVNTELGESIRNRDIYVFQDVENSQDGLSVNDNYMALKTAIISAKASDAKYITAVIPVFPYARQDKPKSREGITAALVARELEDAGASRVLTLDIHQEATAGFFRKAVLENLRASKKILDYVEENISRDNLVVVAPDAGTAQRANFYAGKLSVPLSFIHKQRDYSVENSIEKMTLVGNVDGKDCFFIDDMIDTAGTTISAIKTARDSGAKEIYFATSLPLFNGPAIERLDAAYDEGLFTKIIGTNVINHGKDFTEQTPWYDEVKMEKYFARVIYNINRGISISRLLL